MLVTAINLTQAARTAAIAVEGDANEPAATVDQTALQAAQDEQGGGTPITCTYSSCVSVKFPYGTYDTQQQLAEVKLFESIQPFIPLFPHITVSGTATAATNTQGSDS